MRHRVLKLAAGLLLVPLFALALFAAVAMTWTFVKEGVSSGGEWRRFESGMRHYSDRLERAPDGSLIGHRAAHPIATGAALLAGSWIAALLTGWALERLRRSYYADAES